MSRALPFSLFVMALLSVVAGHTCVMQFDAGGKSYPGYYQASKVDPQNTSPAWWTNQGTGYAPIFGSELNQPDIIANKDASPSPYTADAPAGQPVTFTWAHKGTCGGGEMAWDCSHHGWTTTYLAPCHGDCKNVDKTQLEFFKIHESALIDYRSGRYAQGQPQEQVGYWGTDAIFYDGNNKQSVTIPQWIPSGNYVLRTEVVSIHNNGDIAQRQFWPQAFNIRVTGGNDGAPMPAGVKGTDIYHDTDALLQWDLYWHTAGKTFSAAPGPALASSAGYSAPSLVPSSSRQFTASSPTSMLSAQSTISGSVKPSPAQSTALEPVYPSLAQSNAHGRAHPFPTRFSTQGLAQASPTPCDNTRRHARDFA